MIDKLTTLLLYVHIVIPYYFVLTPPLLNAPFFEIVKINVPHPLKGAFIRNILLFPANAKHKQ